MDIDGRELLQTATRRARRAKRSSGRILVSALGFGLAYYFDAENGLARRERLHGQLRRAARRIDGVFTAKPMVGDHPPVFHPLLRSKPEHPGIRPRPGAKTG